MDGDSKAAGIGVTRAPSARRAALTAVTVVAALLVVILIDPSIFTTFDPQALADRVRASGWLGPLVLIAILVAQSVVAPLPAPPVLIAAGFVYGPWIGFAIGWLGLLLGACACFGLARAFGRPFVERFVRPQHLEAVEIYVSTRSGLTVLALISMRVFMPPLFDPVSYACGLVRMPLSLFLLGTGVGEIPKVAGFVYIGGAAGGVSSWLTAWIFLGPAIGLILFKWIRSRVAKKAQAT
jgi:uncharacterized membrane protein YdjX (TVP38/TMEM64 family)